MAKNNEQIICPVCGKGGIKDYHHEDVVCPCCGTDLSIYRMLNDAANASKPTATSSTNIWKITTATLFAVVIAGALYWTLGEKTPTQVNNGQEFSILKDSIKSLKAELESTKREILSGNVNSSNITDTIYVVKKNDSPCLISRKLYGTERRYKEIEAVMTKPLEPGDTLKLKK